MKKLIYLLVAVCVTVSCKTDDVNDIRNPLPTITVLKTAKVRQNNILSTYTFDYDSQRRISKITRESTNDVTMEFTYNGDNQVVGMLMSGEGGLAGGVGIYEFRYDVDGRLEQYLYGINYINENVIYNIALDQYNTTTPNNVFSFFENMDYHRVNNRYFAYDLTKKGPLVGASSDYHFLALFVPDTHLYYILTKRPIMTAGPASNPGQLTFVNTFDDNDYVIKSLDENFGISVEFIYTLID